MFIRDQIPNGLSFHYVDPLLDLTDPASEEPHYTSDDAEDLFCLIVYGA